jgi:protein-disulfide isomerase
MSLKVGSSIVIALGGHVNRRESTSLSPERAARDNARVPEVAVKAMPRRGRLWVVLLLAIALFGLGYLVVEIATVEPGDPVVHVEGINDAQRLFGGVPQEGDRLGSADAPVTIQVFNDIQCSSCRQDFLSTIPTLAEDYARPGDVQLLYRHYSNAENVAQLGFFGAEAAAEQGYGWQYIYLFFRNQAEAGHFGVDQEFLDSIAAGIEELNFPEWKQALEDKGGSGGPIAKLLAGYEDLGSELGIRVRQAAIVSGPNGTETLQDGPTLAEIERAIEAVS